MTNQEILNVIKKAKNNVELNILTYNIDLATRKLNGFKSNLSRNLDLQLEFKNLEDRKKYMTTIVELF